MQGDTAHTRCIAAASVAAAIASVSAFSVDTCACCRRRREAAFFPQERREQRVAHRRGCATRREGGGSQGGMHVIALCHICAGSSEKFRGGVWRSLTNMLQKGRNYTASQTVSQIIIQSPSPSKRSPARQPRTHPGHS